MTTIYPGGLAARMANGCAVELIDVRPREEFDRVHIRGARSAPLRTLHPASILRERTRPNSAPLFLISRERTRASLAAGMLRGVGCSEPVVVEGGMELWEAQGLPVVHPLRFRLSALAKRLQEIAGPRLTQLRTMMQHASIHRRPDNAWWCRYEFQPREAYRG
ncbi:MAG: rhodanese-like domain-containing protein [Chthoniobacterales bacterium]